MSKEIETEVIELADIERGIHEFVHSFDELSTMVAAFSKQRFEELAAVDKRINDFTQYITLSELDDQELLKCAQTLQGLHKVRAAIVNEQNFVTAIWNAGVRQQEFLAMSNALCNALDGLAPSQYVLQDPEYFFAANKKLDSFVINPVLPGGNSEVSA